jgi:hypothetical protein
MCSTAASSDVSTSSSPQNMHLQVRVSSAPTAEDEDGADEDGADEDGADEDGADGADGADSST